MASLVITYGPARFEIENGDADNVGDILDRVVQSGLLAIPEGATPVLDGEAVTRDTPVAGAQELAFNKATGQKG